MKKLILAASIAALLFSMDSCKKPSNDDPAPKNPADTTHTTPKDTTPTVPVDKGPALITSIKQLPDSALLSDATYNSDKKLVSQRSYTNGSVASTTTYTYDANGQLYKTVISSDTGSTTTENIYSNGLLTKANSLDKGGNVVGYTSYSYNSSKQLVKEEVYTIENGTATPQAYYTTYDYTSNNLTQVNAAIRGAGSAGTDTSFTVQKLTYDGNGNVIKLEAPKFDTSDPENLPTSLEFYILAAITYDTDHLSPSSDFIGYFLPGATKLLIKTKNLPSGITTYQTNGSVDVTAKLTYTFNSKNYPSTVINTIGGVASASYSIKYLQ